MVPEVSYQIIEVSDLGVVCHPFEVQHVGQSNARVPVRSKSTQKYYVRNVRVQHVGGNRRIIAVLDMPFTL